MRQTLAALVLALLASACTNEVDSMRALKAHGFTQVQFKGYAPFQCSDSDQFATAFEAVNARNERVSGAVCCGMLKACTVRF